MHIIKDELFYMNPRTGSIDTLSNWVAEQEQNGWSTAEMPTLIEVTAEGVEVE